MNRLLLTALLFMCSFSYSVNVTFRVNSSTVDGVVDSTSGVDLRGTVTQWGPGSNMVSDGGDYWSLTVALELETMHINMVPKSKPRWNY